MKNISKNISGWIKPAVIILIAFWAGYFLSGNPDVMEKHDHQAETGEIWTCSMHPQIQQPKPGKCPICGMDLIPVTTGTQDDGDFTPSLTLSPSAIARAEIQTTPVTKRHVKANTRVFGKIDYDETRLRVIAARFPGRIEKMYIDYTGQQVRTGDALVDIYSPELITAQQELLLATRPDGNDLVDADAVQQKLLFWGFSQEQIHKIQESGIIKENLTILAPINGYVIERENLEGEYINTGTVLYKIADLSVVWANLDVYEPDIGHIRKNQPIQFELAAYPGELFPGRIEFIDPVMNEKIRTIRVRASVPNAYGRLKPGMFARAQIQTPPPGSEKTLVIPATAPLLTGKRAVVYVADPQKQGRYYGKTVTLGSRVGDYYQVEEGLNEGELVVTNGNFKIDSELQIRGKPSMMNPLEPQHSGIQHMHGMEQPAPEEEPEHSAVEQTLTDVPMAFKEQLDGVYSAYFNLQQALSRDDLNAAQKSAQILMEAVDLPDTDQLGHELKDIWLSVRKTAKSSAKNIATANDISTARSEFEKLSIVMIKTAEILGSSGKDTIIQYHCPMAFNDRGADWLQNKKGVENPYFGSQMFRCGAEVKILSAAGDSGGKK